MSGSGKVSLVTKLCPPFISGCGWRSVRNDRARAKNERPTPHRSAEDDVILEILTHCGQIYLNRNLCSLQDGTTPDATQLKDVRRLDGAVEHE